MSNFIFLKKNNNDLFKLIAEAENLFRDEYFEQSIVQVRRFAENLCKDLLQEKVLPDDTFDSMIQKIKDNSFSNIRMKELADDLYFLKKHGNNSAHSISAEQNGKTALECLERAFEIAIMYSNVKFGYDKSLDKSVFSEELLMTGKITAKKSAPKLAEKYSQKLTSTRETNKKSFKLSANEKKKSVIKTKVKEEPKIKEKIQKKAPALKPTIKRKKKSKSFRKKKKGTNNFSNILISLLTFTFMYFLYMFALTAIK